MAIAGALEIQLTADVARMRSDLQGAKSTLDGWARDVDRTLTQVRGMFAALGVGIGVGAFATLIKSATDALDSLNDLSKTTRIAVEDLAGLRFAAQQSGTNLQAAADSINKLAIGMGKNADKFAALGVTARDPIEAFKQLADVTNAIADPQQRAAVLAEALGKSWQQVAPLLAEGSAKIGEMVTKGREMSGVTQELADQADAFNDKLVELAGNGGQINAVMAQLLPLLNATADGLLENGKATTLWSTAGQALAEVLRVLVVVAGNVAFVLKAIGNEIGGLYAQQAALLSGDFDRFLDIGQQMKADAEANRKAFDAWEKSIMAVGAATKTTTRELDSMDQVQRRMASEAAAQARAFLEAEERKRKAARDAAEAARELARREKEEWEFAYNELKRLHDELKEFAETIDRIQKKNERDIERATMDLAIYLADQVGDAATEGMEVFNQVTRENLTLWSEIGDVAGAFFSQLVFEGKSAFDSLKRYVKQLLAEMIALFAKRWVLQLAGVAGGASAGGNSLAGGLLDAGANYLSGGTSGALGAVGTGAMWLGGAMGLTTGAGAYAAGVAGLSATGVGSQAALLAAQTGVFGSAGTAATVASGAAAGGTGASALSGVYTALANIPVWGWIAMAVIAIGAWIAGNASGGPKVGGSFFSGGAVPGTDNGRFFTPDQGDAQMRALVEATSQGYTEAITRLGGTAGAFNFGLGFDHDPQGSARSRVSSLLTDANGNRIYGVSDREMDDKEVEGALGLEMQRMIIAALQASDLQDDLDAFFDGIGDVSNLTGEQITALIAQAMELKAVIDALAIWDPTLTVEGLRNMAMEGETLAQTLQRVTQAQQGYYQLFFTAEENRARSMEQMRRQFQALGLAMPESNRAFRDLVEGIRDGTVEGDRLYNILLALSGGFAELYPLIEDTADVIGEAGETIRDAGKLIDAALVPIENLNPGQESLRRFQESKAARSALGDWIDDTLTGGMSPLDPMQKFEAARTQYEKTLKLAQGGDVAAISALGGASDTYLKFAREMFASSGAYNQIFRDVRTANAGVAGISTADINTRLAGALPVNGKMASSADIETLNDSVNQLITLIASGISVKDPEAKDAIDGVKTSIERVGQKGALAGSEP